MNAAHTRAPEREGLRQSMAWLHTWSGLVLGWLMFAIFLTGTLAFYRQEISLWMRPELLALHGGGQQVGAPALAAAQRAAAGAPQWTLRLPDERDPALTLLLPPGSGQQRSQVLRMHPQTGAVITPRDTMGGDFFYRFHFELRTAQSGRWTQQGRWVVGAATMMMFVALITGVITHRRIFKDFFTFRPAKGGQRAWLDAHNVTGVLVLPFYLLITFSGLMLLHSQYLPAGIAAAYPGTSATDSVSYLAQLRGEPTQLRQRGARDRSAAPLGDIDMARWLQTSTRHSGGPISQLQAFRTPEGRTVVQATAVDRMRLQYRPQRWVWDADSAALLHHLDAQGPAVRTYGVLAGLHMARFAGPGLRALLLPLGLLGCLMIATGLVLWTVKRSAQATARRGSAALPRRTPWGERLVAAANMATLAGLPLACAAYLAANRLLPTALANRPDAELACFFAVWALTLAWALACTLRQKHRWGWPLLLGLTGALWAALPLVNAFTTPAHLGHTLALGAWPWAVADLTFAGTGLVFLWLARRLLRRSTTMQPRTTHPAGARLTPAADAAHGV